MQVPTSVGPEVDEAAGQVAGQIAGQKTVGLQSVADALAEAIADRRLDGGSSSLANFARAYYEGTAADDLAERDLETLLGAVVSHWKLIHAHAERGTQTPQLQVFNPHYDRHGWHCAHTVVEVVCIDTPFLVESIRMALNRLGVTIHLIVHPVVSPQAIGLPGSPAQRRSENEGEGPDVLAVMHFEIDRQADDEMLGGIRDRLLRVLGDVRAAVGDWQDMRECFLSARDEMVASGHAFEPAELEEARAFLDWMGEENFTFLGYREYRYDDASDALLIAGGGGLGVLRGGSAEERSRSYDALASEGRDAYRQWEPVSVTKSHRRATVHRPVFMDYVSIKRWDESGTRLVGEHRFVGLYTAEAYNRSPRFIPFLRLKIDKVMSRAGYSADGHASKALVNILETMPRDILFQVDDEVLHRSATDILHLQERQKVLLLVYPDRYHRFVSCVVYVPRERYNTEVRLRIQALLSEAYGAHPADFSAQLGESVLARMHFVLSYMKPDPDDALSVMAGPDPVSSPVSGPSATVQPMVARIRSVDQDHLEARIARITRSWRDDFASAMVEYFGEERGVSLLKRYGGAFRADYREQYTSKSAVFDVEAMESLDRKGSLEFKLYRTLDAKPNELRLKLYHQRTPITLSDVMPMLENMGLRVEEEHPSKIKRRVAGSDGATRDARVWIHDFGMNMRHGEANEIETLREPFESCFARVWLGDVENDGFNRLVLLAGLSWREIVILRAYCKYFRQSGSPFGQDYIEFALAENPAIARDLIALFHARLLPGDDRLSSGGEDESVVLERVERALEHVESLDQDRILRAYLELISATLRTNYYQSADRRDADVPKSYVSFKFDPSRISFLPQPRPRYEIFVYSPRVEAVHLRGGPVARGGIRWSDRREDFRTEVLGLVKAQMVKNAVIVPMGSKGGFVAKALPFDAGREAVMNEVVSAYRTFMSGMLDITDNFSHAEVVKPPDVRCHDGDDPYLVVAADKGTATFSDFANEVAVDYGFWLGDAFASGGSAGYDHKGMGITARGAWESVKRHFREQGIDIQNQPFTVVGVGDMAGDVFGNGMLLSRQTKLVAAFNHQHIFLDPDPDPESSYGERERLFNTPGTSWADYDPSLLSEGGHVFERSAKSLLVSEQARAALALDRHGFTPNELIHELLKAPVDLLWNGGIGTYVKGSGESHADVGDRTNDALRVDAVDLRCKVIGEGGNLGLTQLSRIEFALAGGHVNTDAIDNSAGVDCSDHEVNIKVLVNQVVDDGELTGKQRNQLLASMTDDVGALVLRNNYLQTQALSLAASQAVPMLEVHERLIEYLERHAGLVRSIEFLPERDQIQERKAHSVGLTAPEISVLMAYSKIHLYQSLLDSTFPDSKLVQHELTDYFPDVLGERYPEQIVNHRLRREIISTQIANEIVNRAGTTYAMRLVEEARAQPAEIATVYTVVRTIFSLREVWCAVESLDNQVTAALQTRMLLHTRKLLDRASRWCLRNLADLQLGEGPGEAILERYRKGISAVGSGIADWLTGPSLGAYQSECDALVSAGVPAELAAKISMLDEWFTALDIVDLSHDGQWSIARVGETYYALSETLGVDWLRDRIDHLVRDNRWQSLARAALRDELYVQLRGLARDALANGSADATPEQLVGEWVGSRGAALERWRAVLEELTGAAQVDFAMLSVAMREFRGLAGS